jgi:hypothetical protein
MDTDTDIAPALTAEEWAASGKTGAGADRGVWVGYWTGGDDGRDRLAIEDGDGAAVETPEMRHALAALALHEQPFGFTREDVEHLRLVAGQCDALRLGANHAYVLRNLAARLAALLPPE